MWHLTSHKHPSVVMLTCTFKGGRMETCITHTHTHKILCKVFDEFGRWRGPKGVQGAFPKWVLQLFVGSQGAI